MSNKTPPTSKAINEFLSEAQEFVETLSNNLMDIDGVLKNNEEPEPDLINEVFRCWHTLKGLASTFGVESLAQLAHQEENLLDDIRLGRTALTEQILDSLLASVDTVIDILSKISETGNLSSAQLPVDQTPRVQDSTSGTEEIHSKAPINVHSLVPEDVLEVLTEFEEHRLVTNIEKGRPLYKVRASFSLVSIDTELEAIKTLLKPLGEIITYLPCDESVDPEKLDIDVLLALRKDLSELEDVLRDYNAGLELLVAGKSEESSVSIPSPSITPPPKKGASPEEIPAQSARPSIEPVTSLQNSASLSKDTAQDKSLSLRSVSQTVRVDIGKLDRLMNSVGELGLVRTAITKVSEELRSVAGRRDLAIELHRIVRGFERRLAEMREGILEVRMVPVGQMFDRLARVIRKVSRNLGKEIQFVVSGADTEVDKLIIEELSDPLMHIIRNAIDHGIEDPEERRASGKPDVGTVALTAYQKGNHVLIEVEDDGSGIDCDRIMEAAIETGHLSREQSATLSEREMLNLIFMPGVTTSHETTEISGRGVGMDVVKTNISALGGIVEVQSELGIGTKFTITMPVTLAITPALLVSVADNMYAIPLNTVAEALILDKKDINQVMNTETMTLRGQTLPLCRLDTFLCMPRPGPILPNSRVVIAALGQRRLGLVVDALVGQQDVIIKPLGPSVARAGCFAGVTDMGDQKLALVLDTVSIIEEFFVSGDDNLQMTGR